MAGAPGRVVLVELWKFGILYPVVLDNECAIREQNQVWAGVTRFLADRPGQVRSWHVGKGADTETRAMSRRLLGEQG